MEPSRDSNPTVTSPACDPEPLGAVRWLALLLLCGTSLAIRLFCLACKPFWFDETFSVEVARLDWRSFVHLLWWREANMSLYYLLLRIWLHFGQSPFFIRSLSAIVASATIPAIYWLGSMLYGRRVALIAAALLAFNGYDIRYAQETRSYSLFVLLATLSSGFLIAFLKEPTRRNRIGYVLCSVLAVYAHFYALLLIVAQYLAVWLRNKPKGEEQPTSKDSDFARLRRAWIAIGIAVLPLLIFVAKTGAGPIRWIHRPGLSDLFRFSTYFTNGWPLVYVTACLVTLLPFRKSIIKRGLAWEKWRVQFLFIWLLFPIIMTVLLSFLRPVFLPRYMIFCLPALLLLTAAGLATIRPGWLSAVLAASVLLLSARFVPFVYAHDFDDERDGSVAAANFILDHFQPGDTAVFHIAEARIPSEFVRSQRSRSDSASPNFAAAAGPEIVFPHHGPTLDYRDFTGKPTAENLKNELPAHSRVWVMLMNNGTAEKPDPTTVMLTQLLPEIFPKMRCWQFPRVEVRLYSKD
jgi:4-amino-4-deoxy-L-arabinose transferase-like glycosyltransferase